MLVRRLIINDEEKTPLRLSFWQYFFVLHSEMMSMDTNILESTILFYFLSQQFTVFFLKVTFYFKSLFTQIFKNLM